MPNTPDEGRVWDWTRLPQQDMFIWDRSRFAIWQGGRGSTKTSSSMFRIWMTICDPDSGRVKGNWEGADILVAAPVLKQVQRGPKERFDEIFDDTGLITKKVNGHSPRRELRGGVTVYFFNVGPNGEGAEAWRGSQYALVLLDEAAQMPEKTFMLANATLRQKNRKGNPYGFQCIISTTPLGENWLWKRLLNPITRTEYKQEDGSPMYPDDKLFIIETSTKDAVKAGIMEPDYIASMGYTPGTLKWQEEVEGQVVHYAGRVFEQGWNLISPENPAPKAFRAVYGGIDVGTIDPTAILVIGIDERGAYWVIREFYEARARMKDWIDTVGEWTKEFSVREWQVDSDLTVRLMRAAGLQARTPYKAKDAADVAVNYINEAILQGKFNIDPTCVGLLSEMRGYEYKHDFDGEEVTFIQKTKKGQPDHALDSMRYTVLPLSRAQAATQYGRELSYSIA